MTHTSTPLTEADLHYLTLLSDRYGTAEAAGAEIINLQAILNLPKGTEHFVSDIHGEYEAFRHVIRNASGVIREMIERVLGDSVSASEQRTLSTLIYYPEKKLAIIEAEMPLAKLYDWYRATLHRLILVCKAASSKYTRSKVRRALPENYAYIIEELLSESDHGVDKQQYYDNIIETILRLDRAGGFICALAHLIQRLAIDRLHIIGDIFDRGSSAARIMDMLCEYHSVDIQWGNHDLSWIGAAAGCPALVCNVIRVQAKYATLDTVEEDYGINLIPLATFAMEKYKHDPCTRFLPTPYGGRRINKKEQLLIARMHKAIAVMQFKCEAEIIRRHPEFAMDDRLLLDAIDLNTGTVTLDGRTYPLCDTNLPTLDPANPSLLTQEEQDVLDKIIHSFKMSEKLQRHVRFLFTNGSMYKVFNSNLLFHGGLPMNEDGSFKKVLFRGEELYGRAYLDAIDRTVREGYFTKKSDTNHRSCLDLTWYLWCGADSPVYLKHRMTTFERYFIEDESTWKEHRNPYYDLRSSDEVCRAILADFGLNPDTAHIINGHVPVQVKRGERPIKANGRLFVIDGGFAKAYQPVTGIAGYTLIHNSHGLVLVSHEPFETVERAVREERDIHSSTVEYLHTDSRILVADTDQGREIRSRIENLEKLLSAYHRGLIKERHD